MKRLLKLIWVNYHYCLIRILEFRAEVISWSMTSILWLFLAFTVVDLIYGQVDSIAGWTRSEALVLTVTCSIFNSLLWWSAYPSILWLEQTIRTGHFDFFLLKPVNSQFLTAISRFEFDNYARVAVGVGLIIWLIVKESVPVTAFSVIGYVILFFLGIAIFYAFFFIVATMSFWLIETRDTENMLDTIITSGRYPSYIFKGTVRIIFFYLIPIAFVGTLPVRVLFGKGGAELVALGLVMAVAFLWVSHKFWNFALRHYSSASS